LYSSRRILIKRRTKKIMVWGPWSIPVSTVSEEEKKKWEQIDPKVFWYKMIILFWIILVGVFVVLLNS